MQYIFVQSSLKMVDYDAMLSYYQKPTTLSEPMNLKISAYVRITLLFRIGYV